MRNHGLNAIRRCINNCRYFRANAKDKDAAGIGFCTLYSVQVKDTLCGCRQEQGTTTLLNFGLSER